VPRARKPRMLAYLRQSSSGGLAADDPRAQSIPQQREAIAGYAQAYGLDIVDEVAERDVSGGRAAAVRGLGPLIERVEKGEADGVIAYDVARLGRDLHDFLETVDRMDKAGGALVAVRERVDTTTKDAMARFFLHLMASMAEMERGRVRERFAASVRRAAARGVFPGKAPLGYRPSVIGHDAKGQPIHGPLEPDPTLGPVVTELFRMRARGATLGDCAKRLGEVTGRGHSRNSMRWMFGSEAYLGRIRRGDDILHENTHPPLTTVRHWEMAQKRKGTPPVHTGQTDDIGALLGLIVCASCEGRLHRVASGPKERSIPSYVCRAGRASRMCPAPAAAAIHRVDALVMPQIEERLKAGALDLSRTLAAVNEAQTAYDAAGGELEAFLGLSVADLGQEAFAKGVQARRQAVQGTHDALLEAQAQMVRVDAMSGIAAEREAAAALIEKVTLAPADPKRRRWQPIEERVAITWR
jgi:DNA invertase Pin-like site-specific DNA recombinase